MIGVSDELHGFSLRFRNVDTDALYFHHDGNNDSLVHQDRAMVVLALQQVRNSFPFPKLDADDGSVSSHKTSASFLVTDNGNFCQSGNDSLSESDHSSVATVKKIQSPSDDEKEFEFEDREQKDNSTTGNDFMHEDISTSNAFLSE